MKTIMNLVTEKINKTGALIVAAGMSSRMNDFKPLMKIGRYSMIENAVINYKNSGIDEIIIVTGFRENDIKEKLTGYDVKFVHNKDYSKTQMFDSVCIGLKEFADNADMIFITPADCPFVQTYTLKKMMEEMNNNELYYIRPYYLGRSGHPLLVSNKCAEIILEHDGSMGLKGAVNKISENYKDMSFVDPGILLDADNPSEFQKLLSHKENIKYPSMDICRQIYDNFNISKEIKLHSEKVTEVALSIYDMMYKRGIILNKDLIVAASMLHDIAKGEKKHDIVAAQWIREMGYKEVSDIIEEHMHLRDYNDEITEKEVVYLADKLVAGDRLVTIEQRFTAKEELYANDPDVLKIIKGRKELAMKCYSMIYKQEENNICATETSLEEK
ncbi:DVU_1551 family NTP transferase [Sedimentibacter sp.]|uniref:DVU_1551 family NTP transferase n=2 Tax=Sedimentibacter sp. TaxID=1960295 RepID=UPI0028AA5EDA|nr:NTP transferase domain-containing protein [Sedimentibacter sp.]